MINYNRGYETEREMKKWFKGKDHILNCVDFFTKTSLYEVKSCRMILRCVNGNNSRKFKTKRHRKILTTQLGRFHIKTENHNLLFETSQKENKIPKYIFVINVGNQKIWKVSNWYEVDKILNNNIKTNPIQIKQIFFKELDL